MTAPVPSATPRKASCSASSAGAPPLPLGIALLVVACVSFRVRLRLAVSGAMLVSCNQSAPASTNAHAAPAASASVTTSEPIDAAPAPHVADAALDSDVAAREQAALDILRGASPDGGVPVIAGSPPLPPPTPGVVGIQTPQLPAGKVTIGPPAVNGDLEPAIVTRVVRTHVARLRACYQRALREDPTIKGKVVVRFVVDSSGAVQTSNLVGDSVGSPPLGACINASFRLLQFTAPVGGGSAMCTIPLMFQSDP